MIYIDPPYNTGKDSFVYPDNYTMDKDEYEEEIEYRDEDDNINFRQNNESNPRFHSDWCSMIYSRLQLARGLLTGDGVIFISIDDNEVANLKKICDEVFGASNFVGNILWKKKTNGNNMVAIPPVHDYFIAYSKHEVLEKNIGYPIGQEYIEKTYKNPDNDPRGKWTTSDLSANHVGPYFKIINPSTKQEFYPPKGRYWVFNEKEVLKRIEEKRIIFGKSGTASPVQKKFLLEREDKRLLSDSWWDKHGMNEDGSEEIANIFKVPKLFPHPKPKITIQNLVNIITSYDSSDIILDFFSGSATTAHAVMQLNAEDGGNRKFIMVQLPEACAEKSEAHKAGYANICEIGKERIRRVGEKIKSEMDKENAPMVYGESKYGDSCYSGKLIQKKIPDIGFRVFKVDESYTKDVFYGVDDYSQDKLPDLVDNIEADRSDLDLLYGTLLAWGTPCALSMPHKLESLDNCIIHTVHLGERIDLIACFDKQIPENVISVIAKRKPLRVVFRDSSFANSAARINVEEIFRPYSPDTRVKVL